MPHPFRRCFESLALACALCGCLLPAAPALGRQEPAAQEDEEPVRIETDLIQTGVTVRDEQGRFADGLRQDDFELTVEGKAKNAKAGAAVAALREMKARYARLSSYQDAGVVQTLSGEAPPGAAPARLLSASGAGETVVSFKTFYARPRRFRFEWRPHGAAASRESAVWSDGRRSYGWMPGGASGGEGFVLDGGGELRDYVGEAQRSSSGAAFFVPSLLMKDLDVVPFGEMLGHMNGLSIVSEERFDGEVCHVVGGDIEGTPWLLWVGKESRLLRKTRTVYTSGSFHEMLEGKRVKATVAEEIHRDIRVGERLPAATFDRRPRLGERDVDLTR